MFGNLKTEAALPRNAGTEVLPLSAGRRGLHGNLTPWLHLGQRPFALLFAAFPWRKPL